MHLRHDVVGKPAGAATEVTARMRPIFGKTHGTKSGWQCHLKSSYDEDTQCAGLWSGPKIRMPCVTQGILI